MMTVENLHAIFESSRETYFETVRAIKADFETLVETYSASLADRRTPAETVSALVDKIGYDRAMAAIATAVNMVSDWDARVSKAAHQWAETVSDSLTEDASQKLWLCGLRDRIHSAHIDQIAMAARKAAATK